MIKVITLLALAALPTLAAANLLNQEWFDASAQATQEPQAAQKQSKMIATLDKALPTSEVPEPDTYAMMLAGLALIGYTARRRM